MDRVVLSEYDQADVLLASYTARAKGGSTGVQVRALIDSRWARAGTDALADRMSSRRSRRGSGSWTCFSPRDTRRA